MDFDRAKNCFHSDDYIKRRVVESALISTTRNINISQGHFAFNKIIAGIINPRPGRAFSITRPGRGVNATPTPGFRN